MTPKLLAPVVPVLALMKAALAVSLATWSVEPPPEPALAVYCF